MSRISFPDVFDMPLSRISDCLGAYNNLLFALMTILSQSFFTLMGSHLVAFFLFTVWHNVTVF